jgi:hypothetical protein
MEAVDLQQHFFREIRSKLPAHISFVDDIADLLNISTDSAYRRIRGEKPIAFDEIQKICKHYQVSLDRIMGIDSSSTLFYGHWIDASTFQFEQYLQDMLMQATTIRNAVKRKMIYYEAKDFPPFHYFQFPQLASFKFFFWMRTILSYPSYNKLCFEDIDLKDPLLKIGTAIIRTYNEIPSVELWSIETINSTVRQIEYYRDTGVFRTRESMQEVTDQLFAMLEHVKEEAECGEKLLLGQKPTGNKNYQLFFNEVYLGHNSIMTECDDIDSVFINHGVLNYMMTRDKGFCAQTRKYFENTMKKSSLVSSVSEKERNRFFNILFAEAGKLRK